MQFWLGKFYRFGIEKGNSGPTSLYFKTQREKLKIREENGFSLINITSQKVDINLHICGGHQGSEEDDGSVKEVINLKV